MRNRLAAETKRKPCSAVAMEGEMQRLSVQISATCARNLGFVRRLAQSVVTALLPAVWQFNCQLMV